MLRTSFCSNFNFVKPTEKVFDTRTLLYCVPGVRHFMRAATAANAIINKDAALLSDFEMKKKVVDVIKWAAGTVVADLLPIAFIPFLGVINAILLVTALFFTFFELKVVYKEVDGKIGRIWDVLSAKASQTARV